MMMPIARAQFNSFLCFYILCLLVQLMGGHYTQIGLDGWYQSLDKSDLTPPGKWFGIAWTTLYFLMAAAATRIYAITGTIFSRPMRWWFIQLLLGLIWTMVFFGSQSIRPGMIILGCNLVAVALTLLQFSGLDKRAGWYIAPLFLWLLFATYLNIYIAQHN